MARGRVCIAPVPALSATSEKEEGAGVVALSADTKLKVSKSVLHGTS